jgi:hypothetical protein
MNVRLLMERKNKKILIVFTGVTILSFIFIFLGLKIAAGSLLSIQNSLLLLGFCLLIGAVSAAFYRFNLKTAWIFFNAGVMVGLFEMYRTFFKDLSGWEDLVALASLFAWILIGLGAGLVIQLIIYLYHKFAKKK